MIYSRLNADELNLDNLITRNLNDDPGRILVIVPTRRKQRNYKKQVITDRGNKDAARINIETFESLATRLLKSGSYSYNIPSDAAALVLLRQCINYKELSYFNAYKPEIPFGTLEKILNVIKEYKRHGIRPEDLRKNLSGAPVSEKNKIEDIALIFERYQQKLLSLNYRETGDLYADFISTPGDSLKNSFFSLFENVSLIVISGFDEFTTLEIDVINRLSSIVDNNLYISLDVHGNRNIFAHLDACTQCFEANGYNRITDTSTPPEKEFIDIIKNNFFSSRNFIPSKKFKDRITVIEASSRIRETESIAKEIKSLISEKGIEPHNICVVFNVINNYSKIVKDVFSQGNIPFNLTDRPYLSTSGIVISIINFLEILSNNYYYKSIQKALYGSFLKPKNFNLFNLVQCAAEAGIISGYAAWETKLKECAGIDADGKPDSFKKALNDIKELKKYLAPFEKKYTIDEFRNKLTDLIFSFDVPKKILSLENDLVEESSVALTAFFDAVNEVLDLLILENGRNSKFDIDFYLNALTTALNGTRYNVKEKSNYGVLITTPNEIRDLKFDYLFIGGMCDNDLPTKYFNETFYYREYADSKFRNHQIQERFHFYQTLRAWNYHLYLTYPLSDSSVLTVSNFVTEFLSLFETEKLSDSGFRNIIISESDLYKNIGSLSPKEVESQSGFSAETYSLKSGIIASRQTGAGEYSGILTDALPDDLEESLAKIKEKEFSITSIEQYARCPFLYFVDNILKVKVKAEPEDETDKMEFGNVIHQILYLYFQKLDKLGIKLGGLTGKEFAEAYSILFETAEDILNDDSLTLSFFQKEKILGINGDKKNSILHKFFEVENETDDGFVPSFLEASFGWLKEEKNEYSISSPLYAEDIKLRGKVDRIDVNKTSNQFTVIDYKSGKIGGELKKAQAGEYFQLPVYIRAAEKIIKEKLGADYRYAEAILFSLKFVEGKFKKEKVELTEEDLVQSFEFIAEHIKNISEGKFNIAPPEKQKKVCDYCRHESICRRLESK
jgi:ATP-dependent helicase/nuclease subunit B